MAVSVSNSQVVVDGKQTFAIRVEPVRASASSSGWLVLTHDRKLAFGSSLSDLSLLVDSNMNSMDHVHDFIITHHAPAFVVVVGRTNWRDTPNDTYAALFGFDEFPDKTTDTSRVIDISTGGSRTVNLQLQPDSGTRPYIVNHDVNGMVRIAHPLADNMCKISIININEPNSSQAAFETTMIRVNNSYLLQDYHRINKCVLGGLPMNNNVYSIYDDTWAPEHYVTTYVDHSVDSLVHVCRGPDGFDASGGPVPYQICGLSGTLVSIPVSAAALGVWNTHCVAWNLDNTGDTSFNNKVVGKPWLILSNSGGTSFTFISSDGLQQHHEMMNMNYGSEIIKISPGHTGIAGSDPINNAGVALLNQNGLYVSLYYSDLFNRSLMPAHEFNPGNGSTEVGDVLSIDVLYYGATNPGSSRLRVGLASYNEQTWHAARCVKSGADVLVDYLMVTWSGWSYASTDHSVSAVLLNSVFSDDVADISALNIIGAKVNVLNSGVWVTCSWSYEHAIDGLKTGIASIHFKGLGPGPSGGGQEFDYQVSGSFAYTSEVTAIQNHTCYDAHAPYGIIDTSTDRVFFYHGQNDSLNIVTKHDVAPVLGGVWQATTSDDLYPEQMCVQYGYDVNGVKYVKPEFVFSDMQATVTDENGDPVIMDSVHALPIKKHIYSTIAGHYYGSYHSSGELYMLHVQPGETVVTMTGADSGGGGQEF